MKTQKAESGIYFDLDLARESDLRGGVEDFLREISYADVESLLDAEGSSAFCEMARKYAFFEGSQRSELEYDPAISVADNKTLNDYSVAINSFGYMDLASHMRLAICLAEKLNKADIGLDDLSELGIEVRESPESHLRSARDMRRMASQARSIGGLGNPIAAECGEIGEVPTNPFFSLRLTLSVLESPYGEHLVDGMKRAAKQDGVAFDFKAFDISAVFDIVCDHFPASPSGYRAAVRRAFETLFRINLVGMAVVMKEGNIVLSPRSVYSAFWYQLAMGLEGGRAMRCEACGKPLVAFNERGKKRKYCSEACKKWSQRHPGKKRGVAV